MKIAVLTNYVVACGDPQAKSLEHYHAQAERFCQSYREFKPEIDVEFVVIANGGPLPDKAKALYDGLATRVLEYHGGGWWEGELLFAAKALAHVGLIVGFISAIHFHRQGWLDRFVAARQAYDDGLFGAFGSYEMRSHIRSCAIACSPQLLLSYPHKVNDLPAAHAFEHGMEGSFTGHVTSLRKPTVMVTWDGFYREGGWMKARNVFRRGDQSNCLCWDHHCDNYASAGPEEKRALERSAYGDALLETEPKPTSSLDPFERGVISMAHNCLPVCELIRSGRWTADDMERWLNRVVAQK